MPATNAHLERGGIASFRRLLGDSVCCHPAAVLSRVNGSRDLPGVFALSKALTKSRTRRNQFYSAGTALLRAAPSFAVGWTSVTCLRCVTLSGDGCRSPTSLRRSAIFSVEPAMRLRGVLKSGKSTNASSSPAIQKMCICVNIAMSPNTQTISSCTLLCAKRSGKACSRKYRMPTIRTKRTRKTPMTTMSRSVSPGRVINHGRWAEAAG